jgi:hypothetical protein
MDEHERLVRLDTHKWANARYGDYHEKAVKCLEQAEAVNADLRRTVLIGSAGAIGLLASQFADASAFQTTVFAVAILFFGFAIRSSVQAMLAQYPELSKAALVWEEYAQTVHKHYYSDENIQRALNEKGPTPAPPIPTVTTPLANKLFSQAYGAMLGGGLMAALGVIAPVLWPELEGLWSLIAALLER